MNKYVLSFLFLLVAASVLGQSKSKVNLVSSSNMRRAPGPDGKPIIKVRNGVFRQDYSTLTSDSAYFNPDLNTVDAFGHVVINQGDTVHIYSDKLHYDGNTKVAVLTDHVVMVDKDATLTTNNFTYNTATRIGTYVDGGKLVNKENTLTSKNGYYFAFTRDAYFKYDVICKTPDAVIKTDTMRYNSGTRINYFYGPTIITGKDKDNLYTENGTYNTVLKQAAFGKKNLYTQGSKSLKGDSLFYDRLKGYGRAVKHVTFTDAEQKITLKGDLGEYFKTSEQAVVTQNAYMIFVTEDSTATKTVATDSLAKKGKTISDTVAKVTQLLKRPGFKKQTADSLLRKNNLPVTDSLLKKAAAVNGLPAANQNLTLKGITDSVIKKVSPAVKPPAKSMPPSTAKTQKPKAGAVPPAKVIPKFESVYKFTDTVKELSKKRPNIRYDSLFLVADTLKTQMLTYKDLKILKQKQYEAAHPDTTIKPVKKKASIVYKTPVKHIDIEPMSWPVDTSFKHREFFKTTTVAPKPLVRPVGKPAGLPTVTKPIVKLTAADSLKLKQKADSIALRAPKGLSDTARIRIVRAFNNAKIYKSDLQAKADSMFYSSGDSIIRMYNKPMIWTQASQLSGDTVTLQMKNKKLDNLDMYPGAFIVNIEKNDSTYFNQAGGKRMHGTFKNGKLNSFVIIGNAETIYFKRDTVKNVVTDMSRTVSGKAYFNFDKGEITNNAFSEKYEAHGTPIRRVKDEDKILKGFIWKPKDRPISKESILSANRKFTAALVAKKSTAKTTPPATTKNGKPPLKKPGTKASAKDTDNKTNLKLRSDSTLTTDTTKAVTDRDAARRLLIKMGRLPADSSSANQKPVVPPQISPAIIKTGKDSVRKDTTPIKKSVLLKP